MVFGFAARPSQIICFSFERGALDRDVLNAGHAGRGELGAGSLRLVEALLTVFTVLGGRTQLELGDAITVSTSLMLWNRGRNSFVASQVRRTAGNELTFLRRSGDRGDRTRTSDLHHCCSPLPVRHRPDEAGRECLGTQ